MSSFNQTLNKNKQFIIAIKVVKSSKSDGYSNTEAQKLIIDAPIKRALIDTGASNTCIAQECADELELVPIGKSTITTASSNCDVNNYIVDFAIPVTTTALQPVKASDKQDGFVEQVVAEEHWAHAQRNIHSIPTIGRDRGFDVILGMDILSKMHITMFNEAIIMSF
ncbi:expression validated by proteogenomic mapping: 2 unique peptides covering 8.1% of sequence [uncultured Candidatus Thioglobus sp.]|nr:expression validated by proteogenomic mapping: 2 unique peptides covering 8.1% of sequence [uncultured Candidatus Thioglobus sp.]